MADSFLKMLQRKLTGGVPTFLLPSGVVFATSGSIQTDYAALTDGATIAVDGSLANVFRLTKANNTAAVISAPTNMQAGTTFAINVKNTSGGNLTTLTFAAGYAAFTATYPATGNNRTFQFFYDGTSAFLMAQTAVDVAN